jgi:hypothetical protein
MLKFQRPIQNSELRRPCNELGLLREPTGDAESFSNEITGLS